MKTESESVTSIRQPGIPRLMQAEVSYFSPDFLHCRSLFRDLRRSAEMARGKLLDVGCGNKPYEKIFFSHVINYVGCDVVQSSENRADVICEATSLQFDDGSFDTVLCTQVIEHVADHRALLSEIYRVLAQSGVLILSGPMYWPLHEEPFDFFRFTEHGLRYLLEQTGFSEIVITRNGGKWALCGQVLIHTIEDTKLYGKATIWAINRTFGWLDDRKRPGWNPMNYVVTARKK